ncbi:hypothetical protein ANCCEY_11759 [Ancylostoma ceylanicum]|uniref:Uncharacterized protein n=1 Tax=Ancylostoma ceylanicum TaxID=53326 RepID=A0A0D6LNC7_9BILA|nr:hypothetical protein ANCCEY_11759 [Ancylostoma ceylanicum]
MDENYPKENQTNIDKHGRRWMTVEELEYDATLIRDTNSTIWTLFWWNLLIALLLIPILVLVHCDAVEGNLAKLIYRMVDRLFVEAYPRDEYQINALKERFACEFDTHELLVQYDLQHWARNFSESCSSDSKSPMPGCAMMALELPCCTFCLTLATDTPIKQRIEVEQVSAIQQCGVRT